jgi:hypothetical protein
MLAIAKATSDIKGAATPTAFHDAVKQAFITGLNVNFSVALGNRDINSDGVADTGAFAFVEYLMPDLGAAPASGPRPVTSSSISFGPARDPYVATGLVKVAPGSADAFAPVQFGGTVLNGSERKVMLISEPRASVVLEPGESSKLIGKRWPAPRRACMCTSWRPCRPLPTSTVTARPTQTAMPS